MTDKIIPHKAPQLWGEVRPGQEASIQITADEPKIRAKYIGSGRFASVYRVGDEVIIYVFHGDLSKSILAQAYREMPTSPHLPKIKRLGSFFLYDGNKGKVQVYRGRYYRPVIKKTLSPYNQNILEILQDAHEQAWHKFPHDIVRSYEADEFNSIILDAKGLPKSIVVALHALFYISHDWGDHYIFDAFQWKRPNRNVGLNNRDQLVFIDPMFDAEKLRDDYRGRQRLAKNELNFENRS